MLNLAAFHAFLALFQLQETHRLRYISTSDGDQICTKDFESVAVLMKHLKPVLDEIADDKVPLDDILLKECEELDAAVNEAREFIERLSPKMSRIFSVLQSEPLLAKIRSRSLEICRIVCKSLQTSMSSSSLAGVQNCMKELQCWKPECMPKLIEQAFGNKNDQAIPSTEHVDEIIKLLGITSSPELLRECIAVERERMKAHAEKPNEIEQINQMINLLSIIRDHMLKHGYFDTTNTIPIPSYFRCPLSLDLMLDPVIVASGQTFERSSIQKWLDIGSNICPQTRQNLSHTNLIPNYTIKSLISNWCEENNLKLSATSGGSYALLPLPSLSNQLLTQDVIRTDSFGCSQNSSNSTSRSSVDAGNGCCREKGCDKLSGFDEEDSNAYRSRETEKSESHHKHSYTHSRNQSVSSVISSSDYVPTATSEIMPECFTHLSRRGSQSSKTGTERLVDRKNEPTTTYSQSEKLVKDLSSQSNEAQAVAAAEIRLLTKNNDKNRALIGKCGAIHPLISLLHSEVNATQEHAVTALLNLSINEENKVAIAEAGAIDPLIHVLKTGNNAARENSAAALFSLSVLEENKVKIGRSGAVKLLVDLLASGTVRGKKDAATALFNLSICHENKARIVQAGAVKHLVELLDAPGMVDKAAALLANLCTISEGRLAIAREGGIPSIVEVVESGSQRGKENAASILLQMCLHSSKFCGMVLQEGAVPPLVALSQTGTPRAKEKAQQLLSHFRSQREGATAKKSVK
ncbi:hypothetical protein Nepgr_029826 [Nepenthes gracilis]|uniref:RING-type E3 ubiquitin transferase n=1 Tax=Nepenthes gracilis TaxID=150966 RepID=A0AAD3TF94_NEPGR|nr:hypothetical protein Nepgr_029826 [Nepenthes gracilis]